MRMTRTSLFFATALLAAAPLVMAKAEGTNKHTNKAEYYNQRVAPASGEGDRSERISYRDSRGEKSTIWGYELDKSHATVPQNNRDKRNDAVTDRPMEFRKSVY
jgi:hypothetical protein